MTEDKNDCNFRVRTELRNVIGTKNNYNCRSIGHIFLSVCVFPRLYSRTLLKKHNKIEKEFIYEFICETEMYNISSLCTFQFHRSFYRYLNVVVEIPTCRMANLTGSLCNFT